MSAATVWGRLNELSHTFAFDSPKARLCSDGAQRIVALEKALRELVEFNGHVAINSVGDVRMQGNLIKARENALRILGEV